MRILCPNYSPMDENGIIYGLRRLGQEVTICRLQPIAPHLRKAAWHRAWSETRPDLVFCFGYWAGRFTPEDLDPPSRFSRVPFVYWASDDPVYLHFSSLPMLAKADLMLTTAEECIPIYRSHGRKAGLLQFGCNPDLHRRVKPAERHQFVLVANNYGQAGTTSFRRRGNMAILAPIIERGYDLKVWGLWWTDPGRPFCLPAELYGGVLPYDLLSRIYAGADIVLGLQFHNLSRTQTSCRVFEALGCGAFYLGPDTKGTRTHFEHGRHLVLSGSSEDTMDLTRHYLDHPEERARIAAAGQMEAYSRHTYLHRARELLAAAARL